MNPFQCSLSGLIMIDPVLLKENGISYERSVLERQLRVNPAFGGNHEVPFVPNTTLRRVIERLWVQDPEELFKE